MNKYPFSKYHALGNDYIVLDASEIEELSQEHVVRICHRNYGVGSDGILLYEGRRESGTFDLKIYNPDGSVAEKSGNGLRIFSRFLWDRGLVGDERFDVAPDAGERSSIAVCQIFERGREVEVEMGEAKFLSGEIPVSGPEREVLQEEIEASGLKLRYSAASVGNPHCVLFAAENQELLSSQVLSLEAAAKKFGPVLETADYFPNRINVQFVEVVGRNTISIEIWERGAGYTLASGSSSSACAALARRLGYCDREIEVVMPGGKLSVVVEDDFSITIRGSVTRVAEGHFTDEMLDEHRVIEKIRALEEEFR